MPFFSLKGCLEKYWVMGIVPCFDPIRCPFFGADFRLEKCRIWTCILQGNCSSIFEIEVRLLNHPNWTSISHVMVRFLGLPQAALFWPNLLSRFLGLIFRLGKSENLDSILQGNYTSI